jgi:hypothetical protein
MPHILSNGNVLWTRCIHLSPVLTGFLWMDGWLWKNSKIQSHILWCVALLARVDLFVLFVQIPALARRQRSCWTGRCVSQVMDGTVKSVVSSTN